MNPYGSPHALVALVWFGGGFLTPLAVVWHYRRRVVPWWESPRTDEDDKWFSTVMFVMCVPICALAGLIPLAVVIVGRVFLKAMHRGIIPAHGDLREHPEGELRP